MYIYIYIYIYVHIYIVYIYYIYTMVRKIWLVIGDREDHTCDPNTYTRQRVQTHL